MRLPPRWLRRLVIAPLLVAGIALALLAMPIWVVVAFLVSRLVPGRWRILRIAWFLFLYLLVEAGALAVMFVLWVGSGFGWRIRSAESQQRHYRLLGWMLRRVIRSALATFKLTVVSDGTRLTTVGSDGRRPILVLSRHAGPGDSMLLMDGLVNAYRRNPRIVLKDFMQWDPGVDVILNRLPAAFVPAGRKGGQQLLESISGLARDLGADDAFVIFPEGANYTENRRARAIHKLREIGRPDLAERAEQLSRTLPPRSTGVRTALAAAPPGSDVVFVGHAGLEAFVTPGDIWRAIPMDTHIAVKLWHFPAEDLPGDDGLEIWLFDIWAEIDNWINSNLSDTGELAFDDPEAY